MTEFITRNYGNKEFEVIIKTDNEEHYKETQDFARKLIDHAKPQTNADRIRAMSDESVAAVLKTLCTAIIDCMGCPLYRFGCPRNNDLNDWIKWIQQPAEENKNGV